MPSLSKYTFGPMRAVHIIIITLLPQMEMCTATLKKDQVLSHFSQAYMDSSLSLCRSRPRRILKLAYTQPLLNHTSLSQSRRQYHITLWCVWWWCKRRMHAHWFGSSSGSSLWVLLTPPHSFLIHSLTAQS